MRATRIFLLLLFSAAACGGVAAVDKSQPASQPSNSAGAGGGPAALPPDDQIQVVDNVDGAGGQYPAPPPGSSAFFWRDGLGNWFVSFSDGSASRDASVDDVIPPRGNSHKAYHVAETTPGTAVDLWAQLNHPEGAGVDLSSYTGVSFWARLIGSGELTVAFGANGQFSGGVSVVSVPQKVVSLSETWSQFVVRFDDLKLDPTSVSSIDFVVAGRSNPFDLWVDDLGFVCKGSCP